MARMATRIIARPPRGNVPMKIPGILRTISPKTPPRPIGIGQLAGIAKQPAIAAAISEAQNQAMMRRGMRSTPRPVNSKPPQKSAGISAASIESPKNCMPRSEKTAPGYPRALCTGLDVAWLKLGSVTFHVARLPMAKATKQNSARPQRIWICRGRYGSTLAARPQLHKTLNNLDA